MLSSPYLLFLVTAQKISSSGHLFSPYGSVIPVLSQQTPALHPPEDFLTWSFRKLVLGQQNHPPSCCSSHSSLGFNSGAWQVRKMHEVQRTHGGGVNAHVLTTCGNKSDQLESPCVLSQLHVQNVDSVPSGVQLFQERQESRPPRWWECQMVQGC